MPVLRRKRIRRKRRRWAIPADWKIQPARDVIPGPYFRWKGIIGRVLAAVLLIPGLPIIGLLVLLVRLTSRGPGIHRQTRLGKDGRPFTMYKIRTMTDDAETKVGAVWTRPSDARITRVGSILRKLHLDEFPQLFNVLRGEMCLVGPRPERPEFVCVLAKVIPGYTGRLVVTPGVTGLAQINLPPDTDLQSVRRKLALDLEYVEHASPLLDVQMLLCTWVRLLGVPGVLAIRVCGLHRELTDLDPSPPLSDEASVLHDSFASPASIIVQAADDGPGDNGNGNGAGDGDAERLSELRPNTLPKPR